MFRIAVFVGAICTICALGCEGNLPAVSEKKSDVTRTGAHSKDKDADRAEAEAFLLDLKKVQTAQEEKYHLEKFGQWLRASGYKIRVEKDGSSYRLDCPYFPPVTPWADHEFLDAKNLELLPLLETDGQ